jgi:hypothetical protein
MPSGGGEKSCMFISETNKQEKWVSVFEGVAARRGKKKKPPSIHRGFFKELELRFSLGR